MNWKAFVLVAFAGPAAADYLWLEPTPGGVQARYGEVPRPAARLPEVRDASATGPDRKPLALRTEADRITLAAPAGDIRLSLAEPRDNAVLTYRQARFGRADIQAVNDLELVPTTPGGSTFRLMWKGTAVSAAQVDVDTGAGWRRTLSPAADGTVTLETPFPGLYVLEVSARVEGGPATVDGRRYAEVRHSATLSFEVPR